MRRRLFDGPDQGLGEEALLLPDAAAPTRDRGCLSLMVALQVALEAMGQRCSYPQLMSQSGAGFMLKMAEGFDPSLAREGREAHVVEALRELGREARLLDEPSPPQALEECREGLRAGRPLLALGWGSNSSEWSVVVGFEGKDVLGHPCGGTGRPERHPPSFSRLLILGTPTEPLSAQGTLHAAIARAVPILEANQSQYATWLELLRAEEPYGPPLTRLELFSREQWLSECLLDARDAVARFLAERAEETEDEALRGAAAISARLADQAETLLVAPDLVQRAHLPEDDDWRQQRRELIAALRDTERELHDLLRRMLRGAGDVY